MSLKLALILCCCPCCWGQIFGSLVPAANYFVNGATGSDSNPGTQAQPFATVGKATSVVSSGQLIAVYSGRYPEEVVMLSGVALAGYGPTQPYFDCADAISTGVWSKTGGYTNLYQAVVTTADAGGTGFMCVWENGVCGPNFPYVSSLATLDSATNGYYVANQSSLSGTSQTVYVHATGGGNPASNGNLYEYSNRLQGIFSQYTNVIANVQTGRQQANNGSFQSGQNSFMSNVTAIYGTKHNAFFQGGSTVNNLTVANSYYAGQAKDIVVVFDAHQTGQNVTFNSLTATETVEQGNGLYSHTNDSSTYGTIAFNNPYVGNLVGGIGMGATTQIINGGTIYQSVTMGQAFSKLLNATVVGQISIPYGNNIEIGNVTASGSNTNGTIYAAASAPNPFILNLHDSTISNSANYQQSVGLYSNPSSLISLRNTFLAAESAGGPCYLCGPDIALPAGATIDYNTYHYINNVGTMLYPATPQYNFYNSGDWAAWQALGYDIHGTRTTP